MNILFSWKASILIITYKLKNILIHTRFKVQNLNCLLGIILFCLMIIFPYKLTLFKLALIILNILLIVYKMYKGIQINFNLSLLIWILLYLFINVFFIIYGILNYNPGALNFIFVDVIWVVFYTFLIININKEYFIKLFKIFNLSLVIISISGILAFVKFNFLSGGENFLGFLKIIRPGFPLFAIHSGSIVSFIYIFLFLLHYL